MGIRVQDIIQDLGRSVNAACKQLGKERVSVDIPEVEITLNLDAELDGEADKSEDKSEVEGKTDQEADVSVKAYSQRFTMDDRLFREKGISFHRIATVHNRSDRKENFTLRVVFIPGEDV